MKNSNLRSFLPVISLCLITLFSAVAAHADPVTLTFTGTSGNTSAGGSEYAYPYYFSITSGGETVSGVKLECISFYNQITSGESWTATIQSISTDAEKAAAWLLNDAMVNPQNNASDQDAAWYLFATAPSSGNNDQLLAAQAFVRDHPTADVYSDFQLYVPQDGSQNWGGTPQEFIGVTPEPGSLLLLGTGLGLMALALFRTKSVA